MSSGISSHGEAVALEDFVAKNDSIGAMLSLSKSDEKSVWAASTESLKRQDSDRILALRAMKIISRDKTYLDDIVDEESILQLLKCAGIAQDSVLEKSDQKLMLEALRCLNNVAFQSAVGRALCARLGVLPNVLRATTEWKTAGVALEALVMHLKIVFLITALCQETRQEVASDHRGLARLVALLNALVGDAKGRVECSAATMCPSLSDAEVDVAVVALQILFNVTLPLCDREDLDEEEQSQMVDVCEVIHSLLFVACDSHDKRIALATNCTNLLCNVPMKCTHPLMGPVKKDLVAAGTEELEYDGHCMNAPRAILDLLIDKINKPDGRLKDCLTPVLSALCSLCRFHRPVRKFLRAQVLPPLRDVRSRPEVGNEARNKLCKLLTSPADGVASCVAEFLFILCKESVARLVKYTGYGNAAGLLARRGLMLGGKGDNAAEYSEEEEDSDTEEYLENAHKVNPIVGCVEPERPSPFEGMSDEQKEYEAMKLVNLINDLQKVGVVRPAVPGPDGRPREVEHILQLQEAADGRGRTGEADSDDDN